MQISEIFKSIDGEGPRAGYPATFVRTMHCPLACEWCDSLYAVKGNDFKNMTVDEVLEEVRTIGLKRVTCTGGEPIIQPDFYELVTRLSDEGYEVQIETSGAVNYTPYLRIPGVFVTADWKCPSSGMNVRMDGNREWIKCLSNRDVLKFVVGSKEDLDHLREIVPLTVAQIFVSPVFGRIDPKEIVEYLLENRLDDCRVQLQLHKIIWPADMRGV